MRPFSLFLAALLCLSAAAWGQNAPKPQLALDSPAPEILSTALDGSPVALAALRAKNPGKILVLQFASLTDPIFRAHLSTVEKMADHDASQAAFVILYQKEAHAADGPDPLDVNIPDGFNLAEPASLAERQKRAQQMIDRLHITSQGVLVDAWNNTSSLRYGSFPNMTFIIDAKGVLRAGYPFMDPAKVQAAIDTPSDKPLPPELKGSLQQAGPAPFDFASAAADMTGGRGPASIASALEKATLTDPQKQKLLVAIAEYMVNIQNFRQARGNLPGAPARGAATNPARAGVAAGTPATKPSTPLDVQTATTTLRTSAEHLKAVIRQNMNAKDAAGLYQALDNLAPLQRLFSTP